MPHLSPGGTTSTTCTKIVNKSCRQSCEGGSRLHIQRADTRGLTAKSSWFCHLLHVVVVAVLVSTSLTGNLHRQASSGSLENAAASKHKLYHACSLNSVGSSQPRCRRRHPDDDAIPLTLNSPHSSLLLSLLVHSKSSTKLSPLDASLCRLCHRHNER